MASPTSTNALSISVIFALAIMLSLVGQNCEAATMLYSGDSLHAGQSLTNGYYQFIMQNDCNLVLYDGGRAIWASNTNGRGSSCVLRMQYDGNLVIYASGERAVWASNTNIGNGNYVCVLQNDRNVVIYAGRRAIWATRTQFSGLGVTIVPPKANHTSAAVVNGGGGGGR
ncbi:hypothetical protein QJS04_geneDACA021315 [Acorus gramineus]|uniref:Bulb-type lectin domain-containing protein n=1 Tax=Acorus gramineus TaxID=55184 RepID=A0AAV9ALR0_ACOGR|nr:hypothetical protein QJS04_geneDACA021315 [Acorus gramineus]